MPYEPIVALQPMIAFGMAVITLVLIWETIQLVRETRNK